MTLAKDWRYKGNNATVVMNPKDNNCIAVCIAVGQRGLIQHGIYKHALNAENFKEFLELLAAKVDVKNTVLFLDNASIHKAAIVKQTYQILGFQVLWNMPYNPQDAPIELVMHLFKKIYRKKQILEQFKPN